MKHIVFAALASAILTGAVAPAQAHFNGGMPHVHVAPAPVLVPLFPKRPEWSYRIDPSILHPIPKPRIPVPGPGCLSCPPFGFDERVIMPRQLIAR